MVFRDDGPVSATALHCVPTQLPGLLHRAETGGSCRSFDFTAVVASDHLEEPL